MRLTWQSERLSCDRQHGLPVCPCDATAATVHALKLHHSTMANAGAGAPWCDNMHVSIRISPRLSWPSWRLHQPRQHRRRGRRCPAAAIALPDSLSLDAVACGTESLLDALVGLSPGFLQPAESLIGSDVVSLLRLQVSADSVLRLGVIPGPSCPCLVHMHGKTGWCK